MKVVTCTALPRPMHAPRKGPMGSRRRRRGKGPIYASGKGPSFTLGETLIPRKKPVKASTQSSEEATSSDGDWSSDDSSDESGDDAATSPDEAEISSDEAAIPSGEAAISSDEAAISSDEEAISSDEEAISSDEEAVSSDEEPISSNEAAVSSDQLGTSLDEGDSSSDEVKPLPKRQRTVFEEKANLNALSNTAGSKDFRAPQKPPVRVTRINLRVNPTNKAAMADNEPVTSNKENMPANQPITTNKPNTAARAGNQAMTAQQALRFQVLTLLNNTHPGHHLDFTGANTPDEVAEIIAINDLWSPRLLTLFQYYPVTKLVITSAEIDPGQRIGLNPNSQRVDVEPNFRLIDINPILQPFSLQGTFTSLTSLTLANIPLTIDRVMYLRLLPNITSLDLTNTGIDTRALSILVCFRRTLHTLKVENNLGINEDARVPLFALAGLRTLYLAGTFISIVGLRNIVGKLRERPLHSFNNPTSLYLASVPYVCFNYFRNRAQYEANIPNGNEYIRDPGLVNNLSIRVLKKNLELHARVNRMVCTQGLVYVMQCELKRVLTRRREEAMVLQAMVRPGQEWRYGWWLDAGLV